jgi:hypothetical protein
LSSPTVPVVWGGGKEFTGPQEGLAVVVIVDRYRNRSCLGLSFGSIEFVATNIVKSSVSGKSGFFVGPSLTDFLVGGG